MSGRAEDFHRKFEPTPELSLPDVRERMDLQDLSGPSRWFESLTQEKMDELEAKKATTLELGTPDFPAYAISFSFQGLPESEVIKAQQLIVNFFDQVPEIGMLFRMRGGDYPKILGVLTPTQTTDYERVLAYLENLNQTLQNTLAAGRIFFLISEIPDNQLGVYRLTKQHLAMDASQARPLTVLAWAEQILKAHTAGYKVDEALNELGNVILVSSSQLEKLREAQVPLKTDELVASLGAAVAKQVPSKKVAETLLYFRSINREPISSFSVQDPIRNALVPKQLFEPDIIDMYGTAPFPNYEFLKKMFGPECLESLRQTGYLEGEIAGTHTAVKIDVSGLSKLVGEGLFDPASLMVELLKPFLESADNVFGSENYMLFLEGDAILMYVPLSKDTKEGRIKELEKFLTLKGNGLLPLYLKVIREQGVEELVSERGLGMKVVLVDTEEVVKMKFFRGGLAVVESESLLRWEDEAEQRAKTGGTSICLITDQPLTGGLNPDLLLEPTHVIPDDDSSPLAYRIFSFSTLLEQYFWQEISDFADADSYQLKIKKRMRHLYSELESILHTQEEHLNSIDNNTLAMGKLLYILMHAQNQYMQGEVMKVMARSFRSSVYDLIYSCFAKVHAEDQESATEEEQKIFDAFNLIEKMIDQQNNH